MTKISNQYSLTNILTADLANSRLGINNVSPAYSLDLTGTFRNTTTSYLSTSTGIASIANTSPTSLWQGQFLQVSSDLILGKLTVNGYSYLGHNVAFNGSAFKSINGGSGALIGFSGVGGFNIDFASGAAAAGDTYPTYSTKFAVTSAGRVAINVTPNGIFHAKGTSGAQVIIDFEGNNENYYDANTHIFRSVTGSYPERMRITSGGDVLISNTDGNGKLVIGGDDNNYILRSRNLSAGGNYQFYIQHSLGNVSMGNQRGTVAYNNSSDYRLKEDLKEFNGLDILSSINFYDFKWKQNQIRNYGVIAHELQEILPYVVEGKKDELFEDGSVKSQQVDITKLVPILGKAIQELSAKISLLENK